MDKGFFYGYVLRIYFYKHIQSFCNINAFDNDYSKALSNSNICPSVSVKVPS